MQNDIFVPALKAGTFQQNTTEVTMLFAAFGHNVKKDSDTVATEQLSKCNFSRFLWNFALFEEFSLTGFFMSQPFIVATHTGKTNTANPYEIENLYLCKALAVIATGFPVTLL